MTTAQDDLATGGCESEQNLGPGSLMWEILGDWVAFFTAAPASLLQVMHPQLGVGVDQYSTYQSDPYGRLFRSIDRLLETVYDKDPQAAGERIRNFHNTVKGVDYDGNRYHALDPEVYHWAHATFVNVVFQVAELRGGISDTDKRRLYEETKTWYRRYGVSDRAMPADYDAFQAYWQQMLDETIEATPAALGLLATLTDVPNIPFPFVPAPVWRLLSPLLLNTYKSVSFGLIPPQARTKMGIEWTAGDQRRFEWQVILIQAVWPKLSTVVRYQPKALRAFWRERRAAHSVSPSPI